MEHANVNSSGKCQRRALWHSARAHTGTHNYTPRDDTHRSHRSQSQSARDYAKLRGVARRASYAVRAA